MELESDPKMQRDRTLDHPKLEFCALLTMAGWLRHRGMQQDRRLVADCPVGPFFVVVSAPILHFFLRVRKAQEPVGIEAFLPEASVERFDEGIVCGFAGPGEVQRDAVSIGPNVKISRHELAALIDADRRRESHCIADSFQDLHDIGAAEGEPRCQRRREAGENVDDLSTRSLRPVAS